MTDRQTTDQPKEREEPQPGKPLWAGRFARGVAPLVQRYTRSVHFDRRLAPQDLVGSRAHVKMLAAQGILSQEDLELILKGLDQIEEEIREGRFPYRDELEDIHMNIEYRLQELIGEAGRRIHTGRSRNDQVSLDMRLFCREVVLTWQRLIVQAQIQLVDKASLLRSDLYPAWTHLQAAQPMSWGHYLLALAEMLRRDYQRLQSYLSQHNVSPLGAGALSGSTLDLDPDRTAKELGFEESFRNSYDVVGDRDFVLELAQVGTQIMLHLSRMAEDFIYFASTPVGWVQLPDELCTGSSMMPQKKNPDLLELMRGKASSVIGHAHALTVLLKGLATSYHRDLQQDKEHLFAIVDIVGDSLELVPLLVRGFTIDRDRTAQALQEGFLMATDLAEYLVGLGLPFRSAHEKVGKLVTYCVNRNLPLHGLSLEEIQQIIPECRPDVEKLLNPQTVLQRRKHAGATGLNSIDAQLSFWRDWIEERQGSNR